MKPLDTGNPLTVQLLLHNAAFHQGLHHLLILKIMIYSGKKNEPVHEIFNNGICDQQSLRSETLLVT